MCYFEPGHDYDVSVTLYLRCLYFLYLSKEETPSYTMLQIRSIEGIENETCKRLFACLIFENIATFNQ